MSKKLRARGARALIGGLALAAGLAPAGTQAAEVVNVYTYRLPELIRPLLQAFTKETGIKVNAVFAQEGLEERMRAEGRNSPADLLITVDIGRLQQAVDMGLAQPVRSDAIERNIPAAYRDPAGFWTGLSMRARVVYASRDRVKQDSITYEALADPKWKGRLCTRSAQHVYNIGLIASLIVHHGEAWTERWLRDVKANLARKPAGGDTDQAKAIYAGECDVALGNTYYVGQMATNERDPEQKKWAAAVKVLFPNRGDRGTHVNVSGAVVAKFAPHRDNAVKLLEFLTTDEAQRLYADVNYEYPVNPDVTPSELVRSWGELKPDPLPLAEIAKHRAKASELVDKVGFDQGPNS
jgi:iron(III) transport system substrate-binding protein